MNIETLREYFLKKVGCTESFPFDESTLVFKVGNKMFGLMSINNHPPQVNLKCDPDIAVELRGEYSWILPGYHMSKKHWNTVVVDIDSDIDLVYQLIDDSYDLIYNALPNRIKQSII